MSQQELLAVTMQSGEKQIDAQVAENGGGEADYREPGGTFSDPAFGDTGVQKGGINEPDDQ